MTRVSPSGPDPLIGRPPTADPPVTPPSRRHDRIEGAIR